MDDLGDRPAIPGGFPTGLPVVVTGGQYAGDRGEVVDRDPDLRPGSVWVHLAAAGTHLVPGYRLALSESSLDHTAPASGSISDRTDAVGP